MTGIVSTIGGLFSSGAKKKASKQAQAAYEAQQQQAIAQAKATQDQQQALFQPYSDAGKVGLTALEQGFASGKYTKPFDANDFQVDPGYAFRKEEGLKALDRTLAARGSVFSGAQIRGAQDYGQSIASEEYGSAYNRYNTDVNNDYTRTMSLANLGLGAAGDISGTLGTEGSNIRSSLIDIGGNQASGIRERGAINAATIDNITKQVISTLNGGNIKDAISGAAGSGGVGGSLASLASIFGG